MPDDLYGYEAPPEVAASKLVMLTGKGDSCRIRIMSQPFAFTETFKVSGKPTTAKRYGFAVIHKEVTPTGEKTYTARLFKCGVDVYTKIFNLVKSPEWGDPTTYDLTITRTEAKGSYYTVTPSPNKGPIPDEYKGIINAAGFASLSVEFAEAGTITNRVPPTDPDYEHDPFADE